MTYRARGNGGMLDHEREDVLLRRLARSLHDGLDRHTALDVALRATVDAVAAAAGRARLAGAPAARTFEAVPGTARAEAMPAAERTALAGSRGYKFRDGWWALGSPLPAREAGPLGAVTVCRHAVPFSREEGELLAHLAAQTAASLEAIALHEQLARSRDEVTGLVDRRRFHERLEDRIGESRGSGRPLSLMLLDVDDLRSVTAAFGRGTADGVLQAVADTVRRRCRTSDEPACLAHRQIAVALPGAGMGPAWRMAEVLREAIAGLELRVGGRWLTVTASIGIAELSHRVACRDGLLFAARSALNEAKRAGSNRSVGFRGPYRSDDALPRR